ncbi:GAF domain-containing protein [Pedobacter endophyticus]|uniref:PAS domain-containing protein n=1 Tax=Pedobacter endophyticus TaxID=2789740 RepID=A0A7S9PZQ0_9SPHI|nr:GAF domain-containing protein [Pedobacter endophyticus]QPH40583.1 PAS domain-containing protein [Pedobacter endophyticus]
MSKISDAHDEAARLRALQSYHILDTIEEREFDDLAAVASAICQVPIVLISLVDENRQWFKSHRGLEASETPIEQSFCAHAIASGTDMMIVEDAHQDDRFKDNPLVTGSPNITFYAGIPLISKDGFSLGTLCIIDPNRKVLSKEQRYALKVIAKQVMDKLELRKQLVEMEALNLSLEKAEAHSASLLQNLELSSSRVQSLIQQAPVAIIVFRGQEMVIESVNPPMLEILNKKGDIIDKPLLVAIPELKGQRPFDLLYSVLETGEPIFGDGTAVDLKRNGKIERSYFNFTYAPLMEDGKVTGVIDMAVDVTSQVIAQQSKQALNDQLESKNEELAIINREVILVNDSLIKTQEHLFSLNSRLVESEMNLQTLADNMSQLAWMADATGDIYWYNKRWSDFTGQDLERMRNGGWEIVSHPEHAQRVATKFKNDITAGKIWEDTFPLMGGDGQYRFLMVLYFFNPDRPFFFSSSFPENNRPKKLFFLPFPSTSSTEAMEISLSILGISASMNAFLSTSHIAFRFSDPRPVHGSLWIQ